MNNDINIDQVINENHNQLFKLCKVVNNALQVYIHAIK